LKNVTRGALTVIAIATALGVTACGPAAAPSEQVGQGNSSASAAPSADTNKAKGFTASFNVNGKGTESFPAEWKGGEGLGVDAAYAIGKYVGYLSTPDDDASSTQTASPSASGYHKPKQVFVIDDKGSVVYKSKKLETEYSSMTGSSLNRVSANGKSYLVFTQNFKVKQDPSSTRAAANATSVTVIDDQGKEISSQVINDGFATVTNGAVAIRDVANDKVVKTVDVATAKVTDFVIPKGYKWYGTYDGVNVFGLIEAADASAEGALTNGTWTAKVHAHYSETSAPENFGPLMRVQRYVGFGESATAYDLMDPHTGKVVLGADLPEGVPFSATMNRAGTNTSAFTSPNGKLVITNNNGIGSGVFSITENKHYPIAADLNFEASSVTDDGYVYGQSGNGVAGYNILKEAEPKMIANATATPSEVSESGIAIFENVVVLKPQG
jgi:hypothetical protein